jgi:hypothetical protein
MANTVEGNEVINLEIEKKLDADPCKDEQDAAVQECLANGCTKDEAFYFGAVAWGDCMNELSIQP